MFLDKKLSLILIFALSVSNFFAQTKTSMPSDLQSIPLPGNMKLLSGYVHTPARGIDTAIGKISKENGLEILYDIGRFAGDSARGALENKENLLWSKEQEVNGQKLLIVYRKDGAIYANFNSFANFKSVIKSNEDLVDFLMMVMTYGTADAPKDRKTPK